MGLVDGLFDYGELKTGDELVIGTSSALLGNAREEENLKVILGKKGILTDAAVRAEQVHGAVIAQKDDLKGLLVFPGADGLLTRGYGICLLIFTADCLPVFLYSKDLKLIGLLHCGWRGLAAGILSKSLPGSIEAAGAVPAELNAVLGPAVCRRCYPVNSEFWSGFPSLKPGACFDIAGYAADELVKAGVSRDSIYSSGICTLCGGDAAYSYRRNKTDGRMVSFIMKKHR